MAALTYPNSVIPQRRLRLVDPCESDPIEFEELPRHGREGSTPKVVSIEAWRRRSAILARRRRLAALLVSGVVLAATWGLTSALGSLRSPQPVRLANSVPAPSGFLYTVQPGDTVWSIASRLDPGGDPRAIVAQIDANLVGTTILPGEHIVIP